MAVKTYLVGDLEWYRNFVGIYEPGLGSGVNSQLLTSEELRENSEHRQVVTPEYIRQVGGDRLNVYDDSSWNIQAGEGGYYVANGRWEKGGKHTAKVIAQNPFVCHTVTPELLAESGKIVQEWSDGSLRYADAPPPAEQDVDDDDDDWDDDDDDDWDDYDDDSFPAVPACDTIPGSAFPNRPAGNIDLGLDGEVYANEHGGKQTKLPHRLDLLPMEALISVGRVLERGSKYGEENWHATTQAENLNHALGHLAAFRAGDKTEPHLSHAACRILFALWLEIRDTGSLEV